MACWISSTVRSISGRMIVRGYTKIDREGKVRPLPLAQAPAHAAVAAADLLPRYARRGLSKVHRSLH